MRTRFQIIRTLINGSVFTDFLLKSWSIVKETLRFHFCWYWTLSAWKDFCTIKSMLNKLYSQNCFHQDIDRDPKISFPYWFFFVAIIFYKCYVILWMQKSIFSHQMSMDEATLTFFYTTSFHGEYSNTESSRCESLSPYYPSDYQPGEEYRPVST